MNGTPASGNRHVVQSKDFFYFGAAILIGAIIVFGFSFTVRENLFSPPYPRPWVLYLHAIVASTWILTLLVQSTLVRIRRIDLHRRIGLWSIVHGALIPISGIGTAVAMARLRLAHGEIDAADSFPIPVNDALGFSITFVLGIAWRNRREFHRRLMFVASCTLTAAAFGRMPALDHAEWFYAGVDVLLLIGAVRDLCVDGKIHPVYRYSIPAIVAGQLLTAWIRWTPEWIHFARTLFGS